jgi:hypothetical protein
VTWTTDPPTESGYYLALPKIKLPDRPPYEAVLVEKWDGGGIYVYRAGHSGAYGLVDFTHWSEKLIPPPPPEGR